MKRIAMMTYSTYPVDARVRREAEALASRGDEVDVICLQLPGEALEEVAGGVRIYRHRMGGKYRGENLLIYLLRYLRFFLHCFWMISRLHLGRRYQVVQAHTMPDFLVFAALIPKLLGAKIILDVHDLMPELFMSKFGVTRRNLLIRLICAVERASIRFADRAIAVHEPHLDALVSHGNPREKFITLLNLMDEKLLSRQAAAPEKLPPNGSNNHFTLIYHGSIEKRYGLDAALRAVARLKPKIPGLKFLVIGTGDNLDPLVRLAGELGLDCVHFSRAIFPMEELIPVIRRADLGVIPIVVDAFTRYGVPTKLYEYVALGVPVVITRLPAVQAYFSEDMLSFVESGNDRELADRILELYRDPQKRRRMAQQANRFNERYNWNSQKRKYLDFIDSLAGDP